jgi:transcriptional regulator of heat shock response
MPRTADHESRRRDILSAAIELYLNTVQPVSSDTLLKKRRMTLSSASIRKAFAELEDAGYLMHPHTSAGRIPTDDGYRFYINVLMKKKKLQKHEAEFIDKIYELKVREVEDLLIETSDIMANFTHYASVVYSDKDDQIYLRGFRYILEHPEFSDIKDAHMVFEALEKKEELLDLIKRNFADKSRVYIGKETASPLMENCSIVVSKYVGHGEEGGRLALIGPKRMAYDKVIPLLDYIAEALTENLERF